MVRDVSCKNCDTKLGWIYEFATEENQRYKEGRVIFYYFCATKLFFLFYLNTTSTIWINDFIKGLSRSEPPGLRGKVWTLEP